MAVDHGLGGKDNKKSQKRREKKAKRVKALAIKALHSGTKKKEVVFDEAARTEWLTGFHKRKQERRKFGLAMQILKDKKQHKESVKEQRATIKAASTYDRSLEAKPSRGEKKRQAAAAAEDSDDEYDYDYRDGDEEAEDGDADATAAAGGVVAGETVFEDDTTTSMFGGIVSVVVDTGVADELFEQNNPDMEGGETVPANPHKIREKKELSRLEKALKEVNQKGLMNRKSKGGGGGGGGRPGAEEGGKGGRGGGKGGGGKRPTNGKKLFHKALGSGALGANTYKASNKGKRS